MSQDTDPPTSAHVASMGDTVPMWIAESLVRCGLITGRLVPALSGGTVAGGVSSDVWRVEWPGHPPVCVKRALPQLRVRGEWLAPTSRSLWEGRWLRLAHTIDPQASCRLLGSDEERHVLVLEWLEPGDHPVWKAELAGGHIDVAVAAMLGTRLAALHAGSVAESERFEAARPLFHALRLHPYLEATSAKHPHLAEHLKALRDHLRMAGTTVIHGDVSPKNVLVGSDGPVLLDAECASPGDPAFDVAFCLNHLLLKAVWLPAVRSELDAAARRFVAAYLQRVSWERPAELDERVARLVPALALARVDGLSPVEYLTEDHGRPEVRRLTAGLFRQPSNGHADLIARWIDALDSSDPPDRGKA